MAKLAQTTNQATVFYLEAAGARRILGLATLRHPLPNRATENAVMETTRLVLNFDTEKAARKKSQTETDVAEWDAARRSMLQAVIFDTRAMATKDAADIDKREAAIFDVGVATGVRERLDEEVRNDARRADAEGLAKLLDAASVPENRAALIALARDPNPTSQIRLRATEVYRALVKNEQRDALAAIARDREGTIDWGLGTLALMEGLL